MEPFAFALPTIFNPNGGQQFSICFYVTVGDGVDPPSPLANIDFVWDLTQSQATNIANLKTTIVQLALSEEGITLLTSQVNVLMAVN